MATERPERLHGYGWSVVTHREDVSPAKMQRRAYQDGMKQYARK
jgi:hypothetical protein